MGFFDARCMVTGVSLKGSEAALVLLQQENEVHYPIALAINGQYDRLGSIDMIDIDENTALVLRYFRDQLGAGAFVVDEESLRLHKAYPIDAIEQLLRGFERNINDGPGYAALNGQPVVFALIAATVWNAIARARNPSGDAAATFRELFKAAPAAQAIYADHLDDVSRKLREFAAVSTFLEQRKLPWKPVAEPGQDYSDDMRQYLTEARTAFHDSEVVLKGLKAYENEVSDLLRD
ncbi:MAG: hypothetical protein J0I06_00720 [Planctomycetes bacterium]|nr:hypothetical protein [Planctomycetota bacterium]